VRHCGLRVSHRVSFLNFRFQQARFAMPNNGSNASIRSCFVALSYHLLIQMPRKRSILKISSPLGSSRLQAHRAVSNHRRSGARQFARRSALSPPTAFNPRRICAPLVASFHLGAKIFSIDEYHIAALGANSSILLTRTTFTVL